MAWLGAHSDEGKEVDAEAGSPDGDANADADAPMLLESGQQATSPPNDGDASVSSGEDRPHISHLVSVIQQGEALPVDVSELVSRLQEAVKQVEAWQEAAVEAMERVDAAVGLYFDTVNEHKSVQQRIEVCCAVLCCTFCLP